MTNELKPIETNYFQELYDIDVSRYIEKKQNLSYVSWVYAWAEAKKRHPDMRDHIYERVVDEYGNTVNYFTDGRTCWVKVGVTIGGLEHIVELPVMDTRNKSIPLDAVTSMDVNKAIQRCTVKAIAKHGLGLYVYAGEDLPEASADAAKPEPAPAPKPLSMEGALAYILRDTPYAGTTIRELYKAHMRDVEIVYNTTTDQTAKQAIRVVQDEIAKKKAAAPAPAAPEPAPTVTFDQL